MSNVTTWRLVAPFLRPKSAGDGSARDVIETVASSGPILWVVLSVLLLTNGCKRESTSIGTSQNVATRGTQSAPMLLVEPGKPRIIFQDRTAESQIQFTYQNDEEHSDFSILESLGGGVAVLDYDSDGRLDLFLPGGGRFGNRTTYGISSALYRNIANWRFADVTTGAGIGRSIHYSHGASVADYNEDGFDDVLITGYGGLTLYQNQGDGSFRDVVASGLNDGLWSSSAAWGDFTGDGILDVYVAHYVDWSFDKHPVCEGPTGQPKEVCPPREFEGLPHVIYFGNGDGTFRDANGETGINPRGKGLGVVAADVDLDGDMDVYVANDTVPNLLFRNDGRGRFEDISMISGTAVSDQGTADGSMGVDVGDYNGDGLPDIWVVNYERENNALYRNQGKGLFRHVSMAVGITALGAMYVGWGTRFIDADLDGDEDLIVSNGHVVRFPQSAPRRQRPLMLENQGGTRYVNVAGDAGQYMTTVHCGRGLATGDLDSDGDEDVVISNMNEPVAVLSNETTPKRNWLVVRAIGRGSTRSALGATAVAQIGDHRLTRLIRGGSSYASTSDSKLHFGCGTASQVDELMVTWVSGSKSVLKNVACNQIVTVIEPKGSWD